VAEGEVAPVGTVLVVIGDGDASEPAQTSVRGSSDAAQTSAPSTPGGAGRVQATPLVRRIAAELGVDLAAVEGSGPAGRITEDDVRNAAPAQTPGEGR